MKLNNKDFEEFLFDMSDLRNSFEKRKAKFQSNFSLGNGNRLGRYLLSTRKQGDVYLTRQQCYFHQNILAKSTQGINNIALYFTKSGDFYDNALKNKKNIPSNTHNVLFMHEEYKCSGGYLKEQRIESKSLHLPIDYFENLAILYPEIFESYLLRYQRGESFYLRDSYRPTGSKLNEILFQLENSYMMGNCSRVYVDAKVLELLSLIFDTTQEQKYYKHCRTQSDYDKIQEAAHILLSDIHDTPSIRELSLMIGLNEKKLKYGFKEVLGNTVYGYLFEHKMNLAKHCLLDTDKNISEIAQLCGYEHLSHFSIAFKRKFGISPMQKRKMLLSSS